MTPEEKKLYSESLRARRSLSHAFDYLMRDPDAMRIVSTARLQHEGEHRKRFGALKHHNCADCSNYYSAGSDRPQFPGSYFPSSPKDGRIQIEVSNNVPTPPQELLIALDWNDSRQRYSRASHLYQLFWTCGSGCCCGVFGDGANGSYDWFIWNPSIPAKLQTSNVGYGNSATALRDVLNLVHERGDL